MMSIEHDDPRLTAYALGEMDEAERAEFEALLEQDASAADEVEAIRATVGQLQDEFRVEETHALDDERRQRVLTNQAHGRGKPRRRRIRRLPLRLAASFLFIGVLGGLAYTFLVPRLIRARMSRAERVVLPVPPFPATAIVMAIGYFRSFFAASRSPVPSPIRAADGKRSRSVCGRNLADMNSS